MMTFIKIDWEIQRFWCVQFLLPLSDQIWINSVIIGAMLISPLMTTVGLGFGLAIFDTFNHTRGFINSSSVGQFACLDLYFDFFPLSYASSELIARTSLQPFGMSSLLAAGGIAGDRFMARAQYVPGVAIVGSRAAYLYCWLRWLLMGMYDFYWGSLSFWSTVSFIMLGPTLLEQEFWWENLL